MSTEPQGEGPPGGGAPLDDAFVLADLLGTLTFAARTLGDAAVAIAEACARLDAQVRHTVAGLGPEERDAYDALVRAGATPVDALVQLGF